MYFSGVYIMIIKNLKDVAIRSLHFITLFYCIHSFIHLEFSSILS